MKVIDRTEKILKSKPITINSTRRLMLAYWREQGLYLSDQQEAIFMRCTPSESITRARRGLKEQYPPCKAVDEAQFEKYDQYKNHGAVSWIDE